jgi:hypothetical protein
MRERIDSLRPRPFILSMESRLARHLAAAVLAIVLAGIVAFLLNRLGY